jgi:hypothetical protein
MFKQPVKLLFKQLSWLLMLCGCNKIIVKPGVKVITIEPSADTLWLYCGCTIVCARASAIVSTVEPSEVASSMELGVTSELGFAV